MSEYREKDRQYLTERQRAWIDVYCATIQSNAACLRYKCLSVDGAVAIVNPIDYSVRAANRALEELEEVK